MPNLAAIAVGCSDVKRDQTFDTEAKTEIETEILASRPNFGLRTEVKT